MSESPPSRVTNRQTLLFVIVLSFVCALILSLLASALAKPKQLAKDLDQNKQMMMAAKILDPDGYFLTKDAAGALIPAKERATQGQLLAMYRKRLRPKLVDDKGEVKTFEEVGLDREEYLENFRKTGYYKQPHKLLYEILPESGKEGVEGYVIPVNGFGLWDAIYGYLAIKTDGNTVIGVSWYDQKETPGLGANISESYWQDLFPGKKVFQESSTGEIDPATAPLGIVVVKGKVADVYGDSPKSKSAVDGMAGATLTGNGVTDAYRAVLVPYRPFLIKLQKEKK